MKKTLLVIIIIIVSIPMILTLSGFAIGILALANAIKSGHLVEFILTFLKGMANG